MTAEIFEKIPPEKLRIFYAGRIGYLSDREFAENVRKKLESIGHVLICQHTLYTEHETEHWKSNIPERFMQLSITELDKCDALIVLLDGASVADEVAFSVGYAHARDLPILGISTAVPMGESCLPHATLMLEGACQFIVPSVDALIPFLDGIPHKKDELWKG